MICISQRSTRHKSSHPNLRAAREYGRRPRRTPNRVAENVRMTLKSLSEQESPLWPDRRDSGLPVTD